MPAMLNTDKFSPHPSNCDQMKISHTKPLFIALLTFMISSYILIEVATQRIIVTSLEALIVGYSFPE